MGFLKNVGITALVLVGAVKGCEYLVTDKFNQITGGNDKDTPALDTRQQFRQYGEELRKGTEGFIEGVTGDSTVSGNKPKVYNTVPRLEDMCLEADPRNCPQTPQ